LTSLSRRESHPAGAASSFVEDEISPTHRPGLAVVARIPGVRTTNRSRFAAIARPMLTCALISALYYAVPVEPAVTGPRLVVRAALSVVAGLAITWLIVWQVSHQVRDPASASPGSLLTALAGGVVFFALADFTIAVTYPGQFVGLETKTDGLYFALATLTTVGYGDVHAAGQLARGVLVVQLLFNVAVIATGASVLTRLIGIRARDRSSDDPPRWER
jgi:voltage-gated potassium channel